MSKVQGEFFVPQSLYLYGTKRDDGTPNFGLFSWMGYAWIDNQLGVMACIGEEKLTKDLIRRNGVFSLNLVSEALLPLADYYGNTSGRLVPDKMKRMPTIAWGTVLDVPTIAESPVSYELEVKQEIEEKEGSSIFLCHIRNMLVDERLLDTSVPFMERLKLAAPVLSPGEQHYASIDGRCLGRWGEPMKTLA